MSPSPPPPDAGAPPAPLVLRANARRNREALVAAARTAFAAGGAVALEDVARAAGVGIATLYRHFPTREALVEAVYAAQLDEITAAGPALAALPGDAALRAWMERYAAFAAAKRGIIEVLGAGWASGRLPTPTTRERITATVADLLTAGAGDGTLRADVRPDDVTALLLGVFLSTATGDAPGQAARLLDLVLHALRPTAPQWSG